MLLYWFFVVVKNTDVSRACKVSHDSHSVTKRGQVVTSFILFEPPLGLPTAVTQIDFDMWVATAEASHGAASKLKATIIIPRAVEVTAQQGFSSAFN